MWYKVVLTVRLFPPSFGLSSRLPFLAGCVAAAGSLVGGAPSARATEVRVRGTSALETSLVPRGAEFELTGRLGDETGRPLGDRTLSLEFRREGPTDPESCAPPGRPRRPLERRGSSGEFVVAVDDEGRFCVWFAEGTRGATVRIRYPGDALHEPSSVVSLAIQPQKSSLDLRFVPEPRVLPLERRTHTLWVTARIEPKPLGAPELPLDLFLVVPGQPAQLLASTRFGSEERVSLEIESSRLGVPGLGTLLLRSAGSETIQQVERRVGIERTARVTLSLARRIGPAAGERVDLEVAVGSALGAVSGGSVEARYADVSVGIAPVYLGAAHLAATFDAPYGQDAAIALRYLPAAPGWVAGEPLLVSVPAKVPSPWRGSLWAVAAVGIGAWMMRTWRRPRRRLAPRALETPETAGTGQMALVEAGPPRSGWRGQVRDVHEGVGLPHARVRILVPSFSGDGVKASVMTDERGEFALPHVELGMEGTRLEVRARWHESLARPLPPAGQLVVNLVLRRRALLDRLVEWARRMGRPWWPVRHDPTPGDLAAVAERQQADGVGAWAKAVERAAYGPGPVDESEQQRVIALEPTGRPGQSG